MDIELWVQSSDCTELLIRAKAGSTELGQKSMSIGMPPRLIAVNGLGGTVEIPGHDVLGAPTTTITFEYSTDDGSSWHVIGSGGPSKWYIMLDVNTFGEDPYDLSLDKNVGYAAGLSAPGDVAGAISGGIAGDITYDPTALTPPGHILRLYDIGYGQCEANAQLMEHLCNVTGISSSVLYLWGGSDPNIIDYYVYPGWLVSFRCVAPANGNVPADPHFTFHAITSTAGGYYDPSYGTSGGLTSFTEEMAPYSRAYPGGSAHYPPVAGETLYTPDQQTGAALPTQNEQHTWTCPH